MKYAHLLCLVIVLIGSSTTSAAERFTVADSIAMTRIADPDTVLASYGVGTPAFNMSPDKKSLVIVTRKGNLNTGRNEYELRRYWVKDILASIRKSDSALPPFRSLAQFETASIWPAIDAVTWSSDSRRLAFVGRSIDQTGQVFTYDTEKELLEQITHSSNNIARFALSDDGQMLIFSAFVPPDWRERNARGYAVASDFFVSLAWVNPADAVPELRHYLLDLRNERLTEIAMKPNQYADDVSISPSGQFAIVTTYPTEIPTSWEQYDFVRERIEGGVRAGVFERSKATGSLENTAFGARLEWLPQALLVNTSDGTVRPLFDAPLSSGLTPFRILWSPDGQRAIIGPTYLPLTDVDPNERKRRQTFDALAEVEVATKAVLRIADVPAGVQVTGMAFLNDQTVTMQVSRSTGGLLPEKVLRKQGQSWVAESDSNVAKRRSPVQLSIAQGMNTPFDIVAEDSTTRRSRLITDLNPQLRNLTLGQIQTFEWKDRLGRKFLGGLVLPPTYERNRRYPVVLQGSGFNPSNFTTDGYAGLQGAYAAQALANSGILVLQLPNRSLEESREKLPCIDWDDCGESPKWTAMVEASIDALDERGMIDTAKVGLVGFSRVGMYVHHMLAFSRYRIAAATICDSISASPMTYSFVYGFPLPGMLEFEDDTNIGAPFWGDGVELWKERSPVFHLDRINAPLRIEFIGKGVSAYWDTFANLKRHRRPVELIHIPLDTHVLQTPFGRHTSLQGNVDWFRYWLLNEEDKGSDRSAQYVRWGKLRTQYENLQPKSVPPKVTAREGS